MNFRAVFLALLASVSLSSAHANTCDLTTGAESALITAIFNNDMTCVNESLQHGANINKGVVRCTTDNGAAQPTSASYNENFSAIALASYLGRTEIVKVLIAKGADLKATSEVQSENALTWAVEGKHADTAAILVQAGSDVNQRLVHPYVAGSPFTALHVAARRGYVPSAKVLVNAGADLEAIRGDYGWTPLLEALEWYDQDKNPTKREMVKYLISVGANVRYIEYSGGKQGVSSLWYAADAGDVEIGKMLIAKGADVSFQNPEFSIWGVLNVAISGEHVDFVKLLLASKVKVNQKSENGFTAMHAAARTGNVEIIRLLSRNGAYVNEIIKHFSNEQGVDLGDITPLDLAISKGNTAAVGALRSLGGKRASEIRRN